MNTKLCRTVMTAGVNNKIADDIIFAKEVTLAMQKYCKADWGDLCQHDKKLNDNALKSGLDRILASYKTSQGKLYIITEYDRSATRILFANEY